MLVAIKIFEITSKFFSNKYSLDYFILRHENPPGTQISTLYSAFKPQFPMCLLLIAETLTDHFCQLVMQHLSGGKTSLILKQTMMKWHADLFI